MEMWKEIKELGGGYEVSNTGKIRSTLLVITKRDGNIYTRQSCEIKPQIREGYLRLRLCFMKKKKTFTVHVLVGIYFVPNPFNKSQLNHKDGNKLNNNYWNLEYVTPSENIIHCISMGLRKTAIGKNKPKKVIHEPSGIVYESLRQASIDLKINYSCLQHQMNGKVSNRTGLMYV